MRRVLPLLALLVVLLAAAPSASSAAVIVGIGDQKTDMFSDARFQALDIHNSRLLVGWDSLTSASQRAGLDRWMFAAHVAGVEPLVSFAHSLLPNRRRVLPTPERMQREFIRFRARYPWVKTFATWNEGNHCGEPVCHRPELVAAYYNAERRVCPSCTILAAEVLDQPGMVAWINTFERKARGDARRRIWGIHNYVDANRLRTIGTRRLLAHTRGQVWFTETGGIVYRRNRSHITFPESKAHAAIATRWLFRKLIPLSSRITRVYLYNWNSPAKRQTWDSAFINPHGQERPAFTVLQHELALLRPKTPAEPEPTPASPPAPPEQPAPADSGGTSPPA
jgi:hypothetical protein